MFRTMSARLRRLSAGAAYGAFLAVAAVAPAHAEWLKAESPHFLVYGDVSEGEMRSYVRKVERFDALLRLYYPVANERESGKLEIFLAHGIDDLRKISPGLGGTVAGFYSGDVDRIFAVVDLTRSEGQSTLFHEYSHHFMRANMPADYPGWFTEGFAEYYATADLARDRVRIGLHSPGRMNSLTMPLNEWAPMEAVLGKTAVPRTLGHSYYAQAWALTHYFMSTPERQQLLAQYLRALRVGGDPVESLQTVVGMTPDQLQRTIRSYVNDRITNFTPLQPIEGPSEVAIAPMARSARDLAWLDLRMDRLGPDGKAEALAQVRERAARYPGDAFAQVVLAKAEIQDEKWAAAEAAVASLVAADTPNTEALRLTAIARMHRADEDGVDPAQKVAMYRDSQRLLARAVQADPTDYRIYLGLNEVRRIAPGYPTDNDLNVLLAAEEYAPQVDQVRLLAAQALVNKGIYQQAIEILAPVASNPHGGERSRPARELLAEARQKAGLAPSNTAAPPPDADESDDNAEPATGS
jgi:tetratricopeptide (TPR) repeat protein